MDIDVSAYTAEYISRARAAQCRVEFKSQQEVDDICARIARACTTDAFVKAIAKTLIRESGMGHLESKITKMKTKVMGVYAQLKDAKTVGIVEEDVERGLVKIAKPMGVAAAVIPVTNGEATPFFKALSALKTRNAIIFAPHPLALETGMMAAERIRMVLERHNWPVNLVQCLGRISVDITSRLMAQADIILVTGGASMVKRAYSSGKPALGAGTGNAVCLIDTTADTDSAAHKIIQSNTFDWGTSCSAENACLVHESMAEAILASFEKYGAYLVPDADKSKLQDALWPNGVRLNRDIVAQTPQRIAEIAGISIPADSTCLIVQEEHIGKGYPFSGEKLCCCLALYTYRDFDEAIDMVNRILEFSGAGHSCGIHTTDRDKAIRLGMAVKAARIMVNQPQSLANSGCWTNGMPVSLTLGCGTWGGGSVSENVTWKNLMNTTWISWPLPSREPTPEDLYSRNVLEEEWD